MNKALIGGLLLACALASPAMAASIDGTWKVDLKSAQLDKKPDVFLIKDGMYHCVTCKPALDIKADGAWHKVPGHDYYDEAMFKVVDAHTTREAYKKKGKLVSEGTTTVSGDKLTYDFTDLSAAKPVNSKGSAVRVGKATPGVHLMSGSWRNSSVDSVSAAGMSLTYKTSGDMVMFSMPSGVAFTAKLGGPAVPIKGDNGGTMAAVKMAGPNTLIETDTRGGKTVSVMTTVVAPDGKSQTVTVDDKKRGTKSVYTLMKQ